MQSAQQNTKTPTVIEFIIDKECNVMPVVPPGNPLNDMVLESREPCKPNHQHTVLRRIKEN